jgi:cytochrome c peroxidase
MALAARVSAAASSADNALTVEKVELGRHLFYDKRLSANGTQSCASCHKQAHAFAEEPR